MARWLVIPSLDHDQPESPFFEDVPDQILPALQKHAGGYVEVVELQLGYLGPRVDMWVNEEGAYSALPVNPLATLLASTYSDVLLMPEGIRGGAVIAATNNQGETVGLDDRTASLLTDLFAAIATEVTS